ncbi:MAG: alpha/beta fold hydrolase [Deltaproteobacteria bacterium]|nr:alpha/beta fold hydrolase [Deltaproteobacteria bacterium]MBW2086900.1 alpha/beta fold hydrolase [Deltaproteobacteria bacterium]
MSNQALYYEVHGSHGPFILLVHGILSSRAQWKLNLEALKAFSRPVIIELFGHGRSPAPDDPECYSPDSYVRQFERLRCQLEAERWFVCGQSLGASLTLRYALSHPERVTAQIFTNSRSALSDNIPAEAMKPVAERLIKEGRKVIDNFPLHPARSRRLKPEIKQALVEDVKLIDVHGLAYTMLYTVTACSVRRVIHQNRVPTLLVVGRFDKQFASLLEFVQQTMPKLEALVFDGGHAVNIDAPERFNEAVQGFISRFIDI